MAAPQLLAPDSAVPPIAASGRGRYTFRVRLGDDHRTTPYLAGVEIGVRARCVIQ